MVSEKPNWLSGGFRTYCNSWAGSGYALLPVGRISPTVAVFCATFGDIFVYIVPVQPRAGRYRGGKPDKLSRACQRTPPHRHPLFLQDQASSPPIPAV